MNSNNLIKDNSLDNKRVVKNTIFLYCRTIITLCITLFTSRAILNILGVSNYGIYNVVCGFVGMFYIVSSTLVSATQRYLNYEFGKITNNHAKEIFNSALCIHFAIGILVIIVFETLGLWFLNTKLNLPPNNIVAANWVFQCSILMFVLNVLRSPFDSVIIAHERMKFFSYVSILEAMLKLIIVYMLLLPWGVERLIIYGFLILLVSIIIFLIYFIYCHRLFVEVKFMIVYDSYYYKEMLSFAGYNFFGAASFVLSQQGINLLLNVFFGVVVNAARGITDQVQAAISKFVNDFTTALNPQIVKSYAQNNIDNMTNLICYGAKLSFLLFLFFSLPLIVYAPFILKLWLGIVPEFAIMFVRLALIDALINSLSGPISTGGLATGNIKQLSIWIGLIRFLVFPITYLAFYLGASSYYAYYSLIICDIILFYVRLHISFGLIGINKRLFIKSVLLRIIPLTCIMSIISYILSAFYTKETFYSVFVQIVFICFLTIISSYYMAFTSKERNKIKILMNFKKSKL